MLPTPKTKEWHDERRKGIGGSDANIIMGGDASAILDLWKIKTGKAEPEDLSGVFRVQLGLHTESFNADWFFHRTNMPVIARGDKRTSRTHPWMRATLDGEVPMPDGKTAIWEAKHINGRTNMKEALAKYQPQLHHNMYVTGARKAYLSVIFGNDWDYEEVEFDPDYAAALVKAEEEFWECVSLNMPPSDDPEIVAPPEATKSVDMTGNNEWADAAAEWLACKSAAGQFDKASDRLKKMLASDVRSASGHGIKIARDKRRALRITQEG